MMINNCKVMMIIISLTTSFLYLTKRVSVDMIVGVLNLDEIMIQEFTESSNKFLDKIMIPPSI